MPSTPLQTPTSQSQERLRVSGLAEFEAGKARKRQATAGPEERSRRPDPTLLGTPRSVRFKNLFADVADPPNLLDVTRRLYDLIDSSIKLPKKGAERVTIGSESAADVKTLMARLLELVELQDNIPSFRRNPFLNDDEEHIIERTLAGPNSFGCKVPDVIEKKLDQIAKDIADMRQMTSRQQNTFNSRNPTPAAAASASYALAASKHAPRQAQADRTAQPVFRPVLHKKPPPPPPTALKSNNTITLAQSDKEGTELKNINYPTLITLVNSKLAEANIKENVGDQKPIQIRSVHRHPSNDVVLYTTTPHQAETLRRQGDKWIHLLSPRLSLHLPIHTVVVHGIPASFQPSDPQHLDMLFAMNQETMSPAPVFVKWISQNTIQRGVSHSSIRIGFSDAEQARRAVEQKVFYGRYNKRTEFGRKTKLRCMNCMGEGQTSNQCKADMMCPYCASDHPADKCELRGTMTSNCTACARALKAADQTTDLSTIFSKTPIHLHHSPLDPTCPTRLAIKKKEAAEEASTATAIPTVQKQPPPVPAAQIISDDVDVNDNQMNTNQ